jgi:parvulin-like peptidyl-prolyl isomerase
MKKSITCVLSVVLSAFLGAAEVDSIAARVGAKAILKSEILNDMRMMSLGDDAYEDMRTKAIERLLILKAAEESKLVLQEWAVDNRIAEIVAANFDGDKNKLMQALTQRRMSMAEWRLRMREDMICSAMRWQAVDKNVTVSPSAMRQEYMKHPEKYVQKHKVSVSVTLLSPANASKKDKVLEDMKTVPFADVARRYSEDSHASSGGKWVDVVPEEVFNEAVCKEIARMPKGTISKWIEIDGWCFMLRKDGESPAKTLTFAEAYELIRMNVIKDKSQELYKKWMDRLKGQTYIKIY